MKKLIMVLALSTAVLAIGCSGRDREDTGGRKAGEKIRLIVSGSATTTPILEILGEAYTVLHPEVVLDFLPSSHTGGGIKGTYSGELDLGAVSRGLEKEEQELGLTYVEFARDAIILVAHQDVPIEKVTSDEIKKIYSGEITRWSQLGIENVPGEEIVVINRPVHTSPMIVLGESLFSGDFIFGDRLVVVERALDANDALVKTPGSLGYTSMGAVHMGKLPLNILNVDDIEPSSGNVASGAYPYYRPMAIVYRSDAKAAVMDFVNFIIGGKGQKILVDRGFAPV